MKIAIDFDGTIVEHAFPEIGMPVPGAISWMKSFQRAGADLILWTMRSDGQQSGDVLSQAVRYCEKNGIKFWAINQNSEQHRWTSSPKAYAHCYIDDAAFGCPLVTNPNLLSHGRPYVNWEEVGPAVLAMIERFKGGPT